MRQENQSVAEYESELVYLSKYAQEIVPTEEEMRIQFEEELNDEIRMMIGGTEINQLKKLKNTLITLQLVDKCSVQLKGVLEDVLVKVRSFIIQIDFVNLDFEEDREIPILLDKPLLATLRSTTDLENNELTMRINSEEKILNVFINKMR